MASEMAAAMTMADSVSTAVSVEATSAVSI